MGSGVRMRFRRYKLTRLKHYHWPKDLSFSYVALQCLELVLTIMV